MAMFEKKATNGHAVMPAPVVPPTDGDDDGLLQILESSVKAILGNRKSSKADKLSAINAGTKLLAIRHKINGGDEKGFFE